MAEYLNPSLHRRLVRDFGHVKVSNEGEKMLAKYKRDFFSGEDKLDVMYPGEYYQVNCPKCSDTRHRLYINHMWGVRDERGRRNLWLMVCYNEGCFSSYRDREDLFDRLEERAGVLGKARIHEGKEVDLDSIEIEPPGPITRLDKLPPEHPANRYLVSRFYDPERLGRCYGVGYCQESLYYLARNRVYAPLYFGGKLRGWQCRYVGEIDKRNENPPPKWWSCPNMKKSHVIYNYDQMKKWQTGVIVEGPGDVWGFGPMAGATLGATMSPQQQRLFTAAFRKQGGVLLYDPEAMVAKDKHGKLKMERLAEKLSSGTKLGVAPVTLPYGDPGSLDRRFMREFVTKEAASMGVKVSWKKR